MSQFIDYATLLASATATTLFIAVVSLIIGFIFAFVLALLELVKFKPLAWFVSGFIMIIRGLPEFLVVIMVFNGIPMLLILLADGLTIPLGFTDLTIELNITNFNVSPILCGIIALSLLYGAYGSQTLRGAFKAIPLGQHEAAKVLALSKPRTMVKIIIPQIWRHALPGLGNQWLVLLKDTALVSLIPVVDIMKQTRSIIVDNGNPFIWYLIAAAIYLMISLVSQKLLTKAEEKSFYYEQPRSHSH